MTQKQSSTGNLVVSGKHFFARSRSRNKSVGGLLFLLCMVALGETAFAATRYVKPGATGDGSSWANAGALQATVTAAASGDEVWVAAGTYTAVTNPVLTMKTGVQLYGGFAGTETLRTDRDWETNVTTIDGQDARRCVLGAANATLDGFTITRGKAQGGAPDSYGGGLYNNFSSLTVANCTFFQNTSTNIGGGVCANTASSMTIDNCTFTQNTAGTGGGIYIFATATTISCCVFTINSATSAGGALVTYNSSPTIVNCAFIQNSSPYGGGIRNYTASPFITNCTLIANTATYGGGVHNEDAASSPKLTNCILGGNTATTGSQINGGTPVVTYSCIQGGYTGTGNINADPLFVFPVQPYDLRLQPGSPCIDNGTMTGAPGIDLLGVSRPQGLGMDIGAYEGAYLVLDSDSDGLPDDDEAGQGCDPGVPDADLGIIIDVPSDGATIRALPMTVSGRVFSPDVTGVLVHELGAFPATATFNGLNWSCSLTPAAPGAYTITAYAYNRFGGHTSTSVIFNYQPNHPAAWIAAPPADAHVQGSVDVSGTAGPGQYGFGHYLLLYRAGTDTSDDTGWTLVNTSTTPVSNGVLATWDTSALPDGSYALRLYVVDELDIHTTTTHRIVQVDSDSTAPATPAPLTISGLVPPYDVATGLLAVVSGAAEPGSRIAEAVTLNANTSVILSDVTTNLGIRPSGVIYGQVQFPLSALLATHIALRVKVMDAVGNVSEATISNSLLPDSTGLNIVMWDGGGDGATWTQATNWVGDVVPGTNADVVINTGLGTTIIITSNVTVNSLQCADNIDVTSGGMTVNGMSLVSGSLTARSGASLTASGTTSVFTASGLTTIDGANLYVDGGASLEITSNAECFFTSNVLQASGEGSRLTVKGMIRLTGPDGVGYISTKVNASSGGIIVLPVLAETKMCVQYNASGTESKILLPSLVTTNGNNLNAGGRASFSISNGGMISVPLLTNAYATNFSTMDGLIFNLDALTLYTTDFATIIQATGVGSKILFGSLTTITGPNGLDGHGSTTVNASSGGIIDLPILAETKMCVQYNASGTESKILLPSLVTANGNNLNAGRRASFSISNGGMISVPLLTNAYATNFSTMDGLVFNLDALTLYTTDFATIIQATGAGSKILFGNLTTITGTNGLDGCGATTVNVSSGGIIDLPVLAETKMCVQYNASGTESKILLPSLVTANGNNLDAGRRASFSISNGGVISVPLLTNTYATSFYTNDGLVFNLNALTLYTTDFPTIIEAAGAGSKLLFGNLTTITGPNGVGYRSTNVNASSGGIIDLPVLAETKMCVQYNASGTESKILLPSLVTANGNNLDAGGRASFSISNGGVISFPLLTNAYATSFYTNDGLVFNLNALTLYTTDFPTIIEAAGAGSKLLFGNLTTITGPNGVGYRSTNVNASSGGIIDLPVLAETKMCVQYNASGTESKILLPSLVTANGNNLDAGGRASFSISNGGMISVPLLTNAYATSFFTKDGLVFPLNSISTYATNQSRDLSASGSGSVLEMHGLTSLSGANGSNALKVQASSSGKVEFPILTSINGTVRVEAFSAGSKVDVPLLRNWFGSTPYSYIAAGNGGTVILNSDITNVYSLPINLTSTITDIGTLCAGTLILDSASSLSGAGTVQGDVDCRGIIYPGGSATFGSLKIDGNLTITSTASINYDLKGLSSGFQYDQINVTGQANLGGTLALNWLNGFVPAQADKFDLVFWETRTGEFTTITGATPAEGHTMRDVYRPNRLVVGELAGLISPAVPPIETPRNVPKTYDLTPHNKFAAQPSWNISPSDTSLYTAVIDENEVLTITPKPNEYGTATPTLTLTDLADGFSDVQALDLTVELILPTPPIPFVFPTGDPLETDNLVCGLLPGTVGPGCPILYRYIWTNTEAPGRPPEYPPFEPKTVVHGPDVFVVDILNASDTSPYETWTCTVYSFDGQYESDVPGIATSGVIQPLTPTTLSFTLSPDTITLGQPITLSGSIDPAVGVVPLVFDAATPPGGTNTKPANINTNGDSTFSVAFQPNEVGGWGFTASWPGNSTHWGSSATAALTVNKAQPNLLLSLSHTSALLNLANAEDFEIAATLTVAGFPAELQSLLAGRTVRLSVQTPDGQTPWSPLETVTDAGGVAHFDKMAFDAAGVTFNTSGVWRFRAEFAGDENLHSTVTEDFGSTLARLTIKEGAGYAILVLGRLDGFAEGHAEHGQTTDYIYSVLQGRGFVDEDIQYLREFLPGEINRGFPVDGAATEGNLQYAIETWARDKMLASPAPLYLILVDHGNPNIFYMDIGSTGPVESITAGDLNGWLSVLQSALGQTKTDRHCEQSEAISVTETLQIASSQAPRNDGIPGTDASESALADETGLSLLASYDKSTAADQDITLIYGACYSGSFIPVLSGPKRILITSSAADEIAYRGVINSDTGLRDGDFFLTEFFRNAGEGRTLKDAFELACVKTYEYTATRTGSNAVIPQHPQLDDNGDGMSTTGYLSTTPGLDGALVAGMDLGLGANAGNGIGWFTALPPVTLSPGGTLPDGLWAEATGRELLPGDTAWLELKTPTYDDGTVATPGYEAFQRIAALVGPINCTATPEDLGGGRTRFSWNQADIEAQLTEGFTISGTYKAYYFLRDGETGQVGAYLVTNIYVSQTGNQPPPAVELLYPDNEGIVNATLFLAWMESIDPNADVVTYRVEVSEDPLFPEGDTIVRDGLTDTVTTMSTADGILNDHDYYWRVIPTDPYGATPEDNDVRRFLVRGSPGVPGAITGKVTVSGTSMGVTGAVLTLMPTSQTGTSTTTGVYFLGDVSQGVYNLAVSAPGYVTAQHTGVIVTSGRYTSLNVSLEPELVNHAPVWTPIGDKWVIAGRTLSFQVTASDIDLGQTLTYTTSSLPAGAAFDPATRTFTWTPVMGQVRTAPYEVAFTVTDNGDPALSVETIIGITVDRGAYISGPGHAVIGDRVELEYHGEYQPGLWHVQWNHDGTVIPDENEELLVIESVTLNDGGWYTATQISDTKVEPVSASFYLNVVEAMPLHGWAVLVALTCLALVAAGRVGTVGHVGRRVK